MRRWRTRCDSWRECFSKTLPDFLGRGFFSSEALQAMQRTLRPISEISCRNLDFLGRGMKRSYAPTRVSSGPAFRAAVLLTRSGRELPSLLSALLHENPDSEFRQLTSETGLIRGRRGSTVRRDPVPKRNSRLVTLSA